GPSPTPARKSAPASSPIAKSRSPSSSPTGGVLNKRKTRTGSSTRRPPAKASSSSSVLGRSSVACRRRWRRGYPVGSGDHEAGDRCEPAVAGLHLRGALGVRRRERIPMTPRDTHAAHGDHTYVDSARDARRGTEWRKNPAGRDF